MESLRIGMFSWESLYSVKVGGISPHCTELAETLAAKGHEVHIFTRIGDKNEYDEINGVHYQRCRHDQSGGIVMQMDRMCEAMVDRFDAVQKLFGKFDGIHGHDWHPVVALNNIKRYYSVPYVLTYHSTEWGRNGNIFGDWWGFHEISHREWLGGYESAEVIVTSENLKDDSIAWCINYVIDNPGKAQIMGENGNKLVKEKYNWNPIADEVLKVYKRVRV